MAEIVLFHHAHGLTTGVRDLAGALRQGGHTVHLPDLYEGRVFDDLDAGLSHARDVGFDTLLERARRAVDGLPERVVYVGFSLGVLPAQMLAQTRPGAVGAVLVHSCVPVAEFGSAWPAGVPVQVHAMDADPFFVDEGDEEAARELVAATDDAELFLYPGDRHLFADSSLQSYDPDAADLLTRRLLEFCARLS